MSEKAATAAIQAFFRAGWDEGVYPVAFPNKDFSRPAGMAPWARLAFQRGPFASEKITIGSQNQDYRSSGVVILQCFDAVGAGEGTLLEMVDIAEGIFRGKSIPAQGITFLAPSNTRVGRSGGYEQINVTAPYMRDTNY